MKSILTLIVLSAVFLLGYETGRTPDSDKPDVVGWLKVKSSQAYDIGKDLIANVSDESDSESSYGELDD